MEGAKIVMMKDEYEGIKNKMDEGSSEQRMILATFFIFCHLSWSYACCDMPTTSSRLIV